MRTRSPVMLLTAGLMGGLLLASNASSAGQPGIPPADVGGAAAHALYLAQQHAYAGQMREAARYLQQAGGARPTCTVMVSVAVQGGVVPLCARDSLRPPPGVAGRIAALKWRARAAPADATRLLEQAHTLDPFDGTVVEHLTAALRRAGQDTRADQLVAAHAERSRVRLLWAGK